MKIRPSLGEYGRAAVALLVIISGAPVVLGQQEIRQSWTDVSFELALSPVQGVAPDEEQSSEEQGRTPMDESFDWRQWRLEERRGALQDTKFEINFRTYYLDRNQFSGAEAQAWAIGGWVGAKTGYFLDHVAFGATLYTSQPIDAPDDRDGTLLLEPGQEGYTVLGELYADIRIFDGLNINIGAKGYDTPFINRNDTRMTPNTFEAVVLQGRYELGKSDAEMTPDGMSSSKVVAGLSKDGKEVAAPSPSPTPDVAVIKYGLGYFDKIKERNDDEFVSMAVDAGAHVYRGVYAAGAIFEKGKFSIGAIDYFSEDIINIAYGEAKMELPLATNFRPKLSAQFVAQNSVGEELLQGHSFSGDQLGLRADVTVTKGLLLTAAFTHAFDGTNLQAPWSGYPGYTSVQVQDFNRAGESAFLVRAGYEIPWVEGLSTYALAVFGTKPEQSTQYRQNEFDLNAQWAPPKGILKGLSLRVRYGIVQQFGGNVDNLTDVRVICNYVFKF